MTKGKVALDRDTIEIEEIMAASADCAKQRARGREQVAAWLAAHPEAQREETRGEAQRRKKTRGEINAIAQRIRGADSLRHWRLSDEAVGVLACLVFRFGVAREADFSLKNARDPSRRAFDQRARELWRLLDQTEEIGGDVAAVYQAIDAHFLDGEARGLCRDRVGEVAELRSLRYIFQWQFQAETLAVSGLYEQGRDNTAARPDNMPPRGLRSRFRRNPWPTSNLLWAMTRVVAEDHPELSGPMRAAAVSDVLRVGLGGDVPEADAVLAHAGQHIRPMWVFPIPEK